MPNSRSIIFACSLANPEFKPRSSRGVSTFSTALKKGKRLKSWKMNPILSLRNAVFSPSDSLEVSTPSIIICPVERRSKLPIMFSKVVFPHPDAPMIAIMSPFLTVKSTPRRAWTSFDLPSLYRLC